MRTIKIKVYKFEELNEKAQEKATDYRGTAVNTTDKEFETGNEGAGQDEDNVTRQMAIRLNATITNNVTTIVAGGRSSQNQYAVGLRHTF